LSKPRVLLMGDLTRPGVEEAMATAMNSLNGWARIARIDLTAGSKARRVTGAFGMVFGGDGTFLLAARCVSQSRVPLLGVNLGKVGFMAEITPDEVAATLEKLRDSGIPAPVERMMLRVDVIRKGKRVSRNVAVNEAVVSRDALSRIIQIALIINGETVNDFRGDGLICATCVGSTAHSLAAGGPIVTPGLEALIISPICPHTMSNRPLVINGDSTVELEVESESVGFALTVDGQIMIPLENGDRIRMSRNPWPLHLIKVSSRSFYETLRTKLGWEGLPKHA
jgi:NAD+ kinase